LSKFYLNGNITDKYRGVVTGRGARVGLSGSHSMYDRDSFEEYRNTLAICLSDTDNAVHRLSKFSIFNPLNRHSYTAVDYVGSGENINEWDFADFLKYDILEIFKDYYCMVLLPKWWMCKEAWLKYFIAKAIGLKVISFNKLIKELK